MSERDLREGRTLSKAEHAGAGYSEMKLSLQKQGKGTQLHLGMQ